MRVPGESRDTRPPSVTAQMRRVTRRPSRRTAPTAPVPARPRPPSRLWPRTLRPHALNTPSGQQTPGESRLSAPDSSRHQRLI
ncbi:hypothetical protein AMELA_G00297760 [Ameiurus melas]|uniref:Uncharacterized protein n=1 Tax=Ameiurus melas TaxID=219545 RepID=A0A7J5ZHL7_AMEME|nr:hypothetical protein AMELA_G00297760 [Ameiurus melas]